MVKLKVEACKWIDDLEESLCNFFSTKEREKITTGSRITCSYKAIVLENAQEAATVHEKYFESQNDPIIIEDDLISVYSQTATTANATVSSISGLTAQTNQTLQHIFQRTKAVKKAYQNEKASLQQLQDITLALQKDTTVQENLAMVCKQTNAISKKTDELEAWKKQFDVAQEKHFKDMEKKMKKLFEKQEEHINENFKDISTIMEKNQETIMTVIQSKNSDDQEQINQLVQSVIVLGNSMKKQQRQVDSLQKSHEDKSNHLDSAKRTQWGLNNEYN
eukprot:4169793-Ditylum_brightwellii.AAC.1